MENILFDKEVSCLYCKKKFKTKKVKASKCRIVKKDTDFCIYYEGESPYFYEINVCPHCGFAFSDNFTPVPDKYNEIIKMQYLNKIEVVDLCGLRQIKDAINSYKYGLLCAFLKGEEEIKCAGLCMRLAWLYRYQGVKDEEQKYLEKALAFYLVVYETENLDNIAMGKHSFLYLLAELNGRLGNFTEARRWFNSLFMEKDINPYLNNMARDQWLVYKDALQAKKQG